MVRARNDFSNPPWAGRLLLVLSLGFGSSCLPWPAITRAAEEGTEAADWRAVQAALTSGSSADQLRALEQFLRMHPQGTHAEQATELLRQLRPTREGDAVDPTEGEALLRSARTSRQQGALVECAQRAGAAQALLEEPAQQHAALLLAGECLLQSRQPAAALRAFSQLFELTADPVVRALLHDRAYTITATLLDAAEVATLRSRVAGLLAEHYLRLRAAREAVRRGEVTTGARFYQELRPWFREQGQTWRLLELEQALPPTAMTRPNTIVALLPLTGPARRIGLGVQEALLLGAGVTQEPSAEPGARLLCWDTGSDPARAILLLEAAARRPEVLAVLGPFEAATVPLVTTRARELGLPLILLSVEGGVAERGGLVFRLFASHGQEVHALVRQATGEGLRRAVILRPDHGYGQTLGQLFRQSWQAAGGTLIGEVVYPPQTVEFKPLLDQLATLPGFEVLFVPDAHQQVGLLASHLAARGWWSVAAGRKPPRVRGRVLTPVQLLGPSAWYEQRLLATAGRYLEGALLATGFALEAPGTRASGLADTFRLRAERSPSALDGYAWDALAGLDRIIRQERPEDRRTLSELLRQPAALTGVTSVRSFDDRGEPVGPPFLLRIEAERFTVVPDPGSSQIQSQ